MKQFLHPILSCEAAAAYENEVLLSEDEEWEAMNRAGRQLAQRLLMDFSEVRPLPEAPRILVLLSKGHNSGDACLAADEILRWNPDAEILVYPLTPEAEMRDLARQAFDQIADRVRVAELDQVAQEPFQICLDGLYGMQFRPPLRRPARDLLRAANANPNIEVRAAVDIPSGLGDEDGFRADFTYATGIAKQPLFEERHAEWVGRLRYVDIGFFPEGIVPGNWAAPYLLTPSVLWPLRRLRAAGTYKGREGHLFILAGSRRMPGAAIMAAKAAVTAGTGLVTVLVPESLSPHLAASVPEAMWIPLPETPAGGVALEARRDILSAAQRADAVLAGPGLGREEETLQLLTDLARELESPLLLDADALQPQVAAALEERPQDHGGVILTPHSGEFERMRQSQESLGDFSRRTRAVVVLKGPRTRIVHDAMDLVSIQGGPVLARGGTGDLLAGMIGARMASRGGNDLLSAAGEGVVWHGRAAEEWARERGAVGVRTTDLLYYLPEGLIYE